MGTEFQPYLVALIYELNCSYRNLSLHSKVQLEKLSEAFWLFICVLAPSFHFLGITW